MPSCRRSRPRVRFRLSSWCNDGARQPEPGHSRGRNFLTRRVPACRIPGRGPRLDPGRGHDQRGEPAVRGAGTACAPDATYAADAACEAGRGKETSSKRCSGCRFSRREWFDAGAHQHGRHHHRLHRCHRIGSPVLATGLRSLVRRRRTSAARRTDNGHRRHPGIRSCARLLRKHWRCRGGRAGGLAKGEAYGIGAGDRQAHRRAGREDRRVQGLGGAPRRIPQARQGRAGEDLHADGTGRGRTPARFHE